MLGSPILYLKGMRILMFQLSGFYYRVWRMEARMQPATSPQIWIKRSLPASTKLQSSIILYATRTTSPHHKRESSLTTAGL